MSEFPKLHDMLKSALAKAAEDCGTLLGQDLEISESTSREVKRDEYFRGMEDASFVVAIESQIEYQGTFYLVLAFRDAIVLSGTLLGVPPPRIQEKKKLAILEADDMDAFSEIVNQLTGSFNTVFKQRLPRKVHLKQYPPNKFIPGTAGKDAENPVADGEYYLLQASLRMAGHDLEQVELLIPLSLANLFDLQENHDEKELEADSTSDAPEAAAEPIGTVLILDNNDRERQRFQEILAESGVRPVVGSLDADLEKLLAQDDVQAILVGMDNADEQELALCLEIQTHSRGTSIPIILCARQWTRTGVLKALKNGARDILLKPCPPDELTTKVLRMMNTA